MNLAATSKCGATFDELGTIVRLYSARATYMNAMPFVIDSRQYIKVESSIHSKLECLIYKCTLTQMMQFMSYGACPEMTAEGVNKGLILYPFHPNDSRGLTCIRDPRQTIEIILDKEVVLDTKVVYLMRCGVFLTKNRIPWNYVKAISRQVINKGVQGDEVYYDREWSQYKVLKMIRSLDKDFFANSLKYDDIPGRCFPCPNCDCRMRFGFIVCPICDATMVLQCPTGSTGTTGAAATTAGTGAAGASCQTDTVKTEKLETAFTKEERTDLYGVYTGYVSDWGELHGNIMKVLNHRRRWHEDYEYRFKCAKRGSWWQLASNCGLGDWSDRCDLPPRTAPVVLGRARIVMECADIWAPIKAQDLSYEEDEYINARQKCMMLFHPTYKPLPLHELRQKYYSGKVAYQNKMDNLAAEIKAEIKEDPSTSSSSRARALMDQQSMPPPPVPTARRGKDKGKGKGKRDAKGKDNAKNDNYHNKDADRSRSRGR